MKSNTRRLLCDFHRSIKSADVRKPNHSLIRAIERMSIDAELLLVSATAELRNTVEDAMYGFASRLADNASESMRQDGSPCEARRWHTVASKLALAPCVKVQEIAHRIRAMAERCYVRGALVKMRARAFCTETPGSAANLLVNESRRLVQAMRCDLPVTAGDAA